VVSASQPPELPEPEIEYRRPASIEPPADVVPGIVPVELLLARTDTHAVLVTDLRTYPTGLEFVLTVRPRPGQPHQRRHDPDWDHHHFAFHDLRLELRFADGRTLSNDPRRWPRSFETEEPDPPFLYYHGAGGSERGWRSRHWLWGLPPPGPLAFMCQWPASSQPQASRSTPASSWRRPIEPCRSGRQARHRPGRARQPVQPPERAQLHPTGARRQPARSGSGAGPCPARSGGPRPAAAACEHLPAR
jgi:hypothetical protein